MHGHEIDPLLSPVVVLVAWTLVMLAWLAIRRAPLLKGRDIPAGSRGSDMPPGPHNWPAHNYEHLVEQPTLFYAIVFALILMGQSLPINNWLAWGYVILRILHSIVQSTVNTIRLRFPLFALSTLCLVGLTLHALFWVADTIL
ncbi:MAPEG family protein [Sphingomonas sp. ASV193]|uniref:MAPEG family protein n=1 Tax=Sphingomonas sp. ASV193 TaxID=3144405 RepID=UPI0032E8625F